MPNPQPYPNQHVPTMNIEQPMYYDQVKGIHYYHNDDDEGSTQNWVDYAQSRNFWTDEAEKLFLPHIQQKLNNDRYQICWKDLRQVFCNVLKLTDEQLPHVNTMKQHLKESRARLINKYRMMTIISKNTPSLFNQSKLSSMISTKTPKVSPIVEKDQVNELLTQVTESKSFRDLLDAINGVSKKQSVFQVQLETLQAHATATNQSIQLQAQKNIKFEKMASAYTKHIMFCTEDSEKK